jgi:hypothetical protein
MAVVIGLDHYCFPGRGRPVFLKNLEGYLPLHVSTLKDDLTMSMLAEESTSQIKPVKKHIRAKITGGDLI